VRRELIWSDEVRRMHEVEPGFQPTLEQAYGFIVPEHRAPLLAASEAYLRNGTPMDQEVQVVTARGRSMWVRLSGEAVRDAHGRVRRLQGAFPDISEIKRAHEQTRAMAEQLTNTLESLTDAFFTLDRQWRFTYLNAEAERLLRRTREELMGKVAWGEFADVAGTPYQASLERAMHENITVQFDSYYRNFGIWVQTKAYPSPQGLAIYIKDVTERVASQREVLRLNAELEERVRVRTSELEAANRELQAFSYSIAHDLRSPLSSIDGFSQVLQKAADEKLDERCRHYLRRIRTAVRGMSELTEGMLALANLSRLPMRSESVDLGRLARAVAEDLRERDARREVQIVVAETLPVVGDARLLHQVLANLVGNAWKFTARTADARIEVGAQRDAQGREVFFVRDNGAGFDMKQASRMFEAFQRLHSPAEFEGTGIGLAIVQRIVARHGGRVWAEAAPGRGAAFFFTLGEAAR
jgi:PAS domain S-box-containing protein